MDFNDIDDEIVAAPPYPKCILSYNTMEVLMLNSCFMVEIPDSVASFPCLKEPHFSGWYPYHSSVVHNLISRSPVLEVLHLEGVLEPDASLLFDISVPTLKTLEIEFRIEETGVHPHFVILNTPKLEDLSVTDASLAGYLVENLDSIMSVDVVNEGFWDENAEIEHVRRLFFLLKGIAKTKHLSLSADSVTILQQSVHLPWPTFSQMTDLSLSMSIHFDWSLLSYFLQKSPNLANLSLDEDDIYGVKSEGQYMWNPPDIVPDCLKLSLKFVELNSFKCHKDDLQFVEYLLNNAQVLEVMRIITDPYPLKDELEETIVMFDIASENCQISLS